MGENDAVVWKNKVSTRHQKPEKHERAGGGLPSNVGLRVRNRSVCFVTGLFCFRRCGYTEVKLEGQASKCTSRRLKQRRRFAGPPGRRTGSLQRRETTRVSRRCSWKLRLLQGAKLSVISVASKPRAAPCCVKPWAVKVPRFRTLSPHPDYATRGADIKVIFLSGAHAHSGWCWSARKSLGAFSVLRLRDLLC